LFGQPDTEIVEGIEDREPTADEEHLGWGYELGAEQIVDAAMLESALDRARLFGGVASAVCGE
jgi:hypothetical protein